ncbi:MAG: septum site-determining protein MinC [Anaerolineales bacterium]|nr:septum site-determining protein MinC [Anaerolineales bacterium]
MGPKVQIKGIRDGLLITLGEGSWDELHQALLDHLDQQAEFLRGARLAVDVGTQILKAADLGQLRKEVSEREITLWAVISESPTTVQTAQTLGLSTSITQPRPGSRLERPLPALETTLRVGEEAIFVRRTLRSGFRLQYAGHVVVIGDVNPGAEIVAGGNIIIWGRLRGTVHAGAEGNDSSVVCALDLSPTQLRIAGKIALSPKRKGKPQPEIARLENGQVIAEQWDPKRERL